MLSIPDSLPELEEVSDEELIRQLWTQGVIELTAVLWQSTIRPQCLDLVAEFEYLGAQIAGEESVLWTSVLEQLASKLK